MKILRFLTAVPGVLLLTACAGGGGLGALGDILGSVGGLPGGQAGQGGEIRAEVDQVDTRNQQIHLRTQSGQQGTVRYDDRTEVIYQQERYPVTALERGDLVVVQAQQTSNNEYYAQRILVEQSVQERRGGGVVGGGGQVQQLQGQVGRVDTQQGVFELRTQYSVMTVSLPYNTSPTDQDRFRRLRSGDQVRIEGELLSDGRVRLIRFL